MMTAKMKNMDDFLSDSLIYEVLLDTKESSNLLGVKPSTLKQSRYTGTLLGKKAPVYIKMGRNVRYSSPVLTKFRESFQEYSNTSEYPF